MSVFLAYALVLPASQANVSLPLLLTVVHEETHVLFELFAADQNLFRKLSLL